MSWRRSDVQFRVGCLKMKFFLLIVLLVQLSVSSNSKKFSTVNTVSSAISQIVQHQMGSSDIDVFVFGNNTEKLMDIASKVIKTVEGPSKVIKSSDRKQRKLLSSSAVFLFENFKAYKQSPYRLSNSRVKDIYFIVYIAQLNPKSLENSTKNEKLNHTSPFRYQYFLTPNKTVLTLKTFVTFQHSMECRQWKAIDVNRFDMKTRTWDTNKFVVEKFRDLNGCELVVEAYRNNQPFMVIRFKKKMLPEMLGSFVKVNNEVSKALNFTIFYNVYDKKEDEKPNNSLITDYILTSSSMRRVYSIAGTQSTTAAISYVDLIIIAAQFEPYTAFGKIFIPFDDDVWFWLIGTLIFTGSMIFAMRFAPKNLRSFVQSRGRSLSILQVP
jgi:hypothetical protein